MSGKHNSYEQIARTRRGSAGYREGYDEARSCAGTAAGAGPVADRTGRPRRHDPARPIPSGGRRGGAHLPLLDRVAAALDADLTVTLSPHAA